MFKLKFGWKSLRSARDAIRAAYTSASRCFDVPFLLVMLWTASVFGAMHARNLDVAALLLFGCVVTLQLAGAREKLRKLRSSR